jgi:hypothetical protein
VYTFFQTALDDLKETCTSLACFKDSARGAVRRSKDRFAAAVVSYGGADAAEIKPSSQALASDMKSYVVLCQAELTNKVRGVVCTTPKAIAPMVVFALSVLLLGWLTHQLCNSTCSVSLKDLLDGPEPDAEVLGLKYENSAQWHTLFEKVRSLPANSILRAM